MSHKANELAADVALRGSLFPYRLDSPPKPNGFKGNPLTVVRLQGNHQVPGFSSKMMIESGLGLPDEPMTTERLEEVNFDRSRLDRIRALNMKHKNQSSLPNLHSSFLLPKIPNPNAAPESRNMIGRADVSTQVESNLVKHTFPGGISQYQKWSSDEVEPFFKELKKHVKAQKPVDIGAYCIAYCQAMADGLPPPEI